MTGSLDSDRAATPGTPPTRPLRRRLAELRGADNAPRPLDARALAALAANPGCRRRALLDGAGVDKTALADALGAPAAFGQSGFAFARGHAFEARVKADGGAELIRLVHERVGGTPAPDPEEIQAPDLSAHGPAGRTARTRLALEEATARGGWTLLDHPTLELEVAGSPAYLEPDAVAVHPDGSWTVVEIKSFPILDGAADPAKVGAAARQAAVYALALERLADDLDRTTEPTANPLPETTPQPTTAPAPEPWTTANPTPETTPVPGMATTPSPSTTPNPIPETTPAPGTATNPEPNTAPQPPTTPNPKPDTTPVPGTATNPEPNTAALPVPGTAPNPADEAAQKVAAEPVRGMADEAAHGAATEAANARPGAGSGRPGTTRARPGQADGQPEGQPGGRTGPGPAGVGPRVRPVALLVCPKDFSNLPTAEAVDIRKQIAVTRRQLARLARVEELAATLPPGITFDPACPADELTRAVESVPATYAPDCLAVCELAFHCRDRARAAGSVVTLGRSVRSELGELTTVTSVLASAYGTADHVGARAAGTGADAADDPAVTVLRRAARLRAEALGTAAC